MLRRYKYDIAILVAEENREVAAAIAAELRNRNIVYFFYEEHRPALWGQNLLKITMNTYGKSAKYVLMITSQYFVDQYWAAVERSIVAAFNKRKDCILQLRLDETPVDGLRDIVYVDWKDNPETIADFIDEKLGRRKPISSIILLTCFFLLITLKSLDTFKPNYGKGAEEQFPGKKTVKHDSVPQSKSESEISAKLGEKSIGKMPQKLPISGGAFMMGNNELKKEDGPVHQITIPSFYLSMNEVTISQYRYYCNTTGKAIPVQQLHQSPDDDYPVANVTWQEANDYCTWVGGRLPTEAEWEYAASCGFQYKYCGNNNASKVAIYGKTKPSRIALKQPNKFGLYDMTGNVSEWCSDWFDPLYYESSPTMDPHGPARGKEKAIRGGAYNSLIKPTNQLHIAYREKALPALRSPTIGFRVAWDK